jgi:hypothetical protein
MTADELQEMCERGQQALMRMDYIAAERELVRAEEAAWELRDFDTLSRLYMPLQEARRQRRQRCCEGEVHLDLIAQGPDDRVDGRRIVENYPFGQLLVAGWGSIEPAVQVRRLQREHGLYVETFLGAVYPTDQGRIIALLPLEDAALPSAEPRSLQELKQVLPQHTILIRPQELPEGSRKGDWQTCAMTMALWERLHAPFLAAAEAQTDPLARLKALRRAIEVDYACELAHQRAADVARSLRRCARIGQGIY